ncbi:MAG: hypothetical protein JWR88_869 [Pseudonocardia sp.]|nr:hypothetical protein [Pseudonocardia sp.]
MGIAASVWFVIAVVALLLGILLLMIDRLRGRSGSGERRRWAELQDWEYVDHDPVLPGRWRYGSIHQGGPGAAHNLVSGWLPGPGGRRRVYVFDHEQAGRISSVLVAVQTLTVMPAAIELRSPLAPLPDDAGLDLLEPVGQRYAFVSDATEARPMISQRLARAGDALGDDVELVWAEDTWVLATARPDSSPERIQELLNGLVQVAAALEDSLGEAHGDPGAEEQPSEPDAAVHNDQEH